jgi:phosphate transport system protein
MLPGWGKWDNIGGSSLRQRFRSHRPMKRPTRTTKPARKAGSLDGTESTRELTNLIQQACLVAKDSAANTEEFVSNSSKMAFLAVKDCEKELDRIERQVDEKIPGAITEVSEIEARQLLACLKFSTDLERIGDLAWTATKQLHGLGEPLHDEDRRDLSEMAKTLEEMLSRAYEGFVHHNVDAASWVLKTDARMNQTCHAVFQRHLEGEERHHEYSTTLLFIAQALERAGDHAKNLAEEIFHLVEGRSLRHELKRRRPGT